MERRSRFMSKEASRDFKDGLFSVFVDNLNYSVDQRSLWDIFKPFGRVRNVFLSPGHRARKCNYAFVRFATMEEVERVVRLTNGMHVYGWPIVSKLASFGWDKRRREARREGGIKEEQIRDSKVDKGSKYVRKDYESEDGRDRNRSFADVVSGNRGKEGGEVDNTMVEFFWEEAKNDVTWLPRCAIGVLRRFDKVSRVNQHLMERGVSFKSSYMGDKLILWRFDTEQACLDFINFRFLWENNFLSMSKWSPWAVAKARPTWINILGVPLSHWNSEFIFQVGRAIGDPLIIDEDTFQKRNLLVGKMLILVKYGSSFPKQIKVGGDKGSFVLSVEEDRAAVELKWIEEFLEMKEGVGQAVVREEGQLVSVRDGQLSHLANENQFQTLVGEKEVWQQQDQGSRKARMDRWDHGSKVALDGQYSRKGGVGRDVNSPNMSKGKGKLSILKSSSRKPLLGRFSNSNPKLVIEKTKTTSVFVDQTTSSSSDSGMGMFSDSVKARGECSLQRKGFGNLPKTTNRVEPILLDFSSVEKDNAVGLSNLGPILDGGVEHERAFQEESNISESGLVGKVFHIDLSGGLKPNLEFTKKMRKTGLRMRIRGKDAKKVQLMMKKGLLKASLVRNWVHRRKGAREPEFMSQEVAGDTVEESDHGCSILGPQLQYALSLPGIVSRGENFITATNLQFNENQARFDQASEENGNISESGIDNQSQDALETVVSDVEGNQEEINKIIETGAALGIDFGGNEKAIRDELRRREAEDDERIKKANRK